MSETLKQKQSEFLNAILDEEAPLPEGWGNSQAFGMSVYRGNYRGALLGAMSESFARTKLYLGDQAFTRVAINHVIKHPPSSWTIDAAGKGFEQSCDKHFAGDQLVAELAWLEWAMLQLVTAPDTTPITAQEFSEAAADFGDEQWAELRLALQPRASARLVEHDLEAVWRSLDEGDDGQDTSPAQVALPQSRACLVLREGERPTFTLAESDHCAAFDLMAGGGSYGELIGLLLGEAEPEAENIQSAAMRAGGILGRWLQEGLVIAINP